MKAFNIRPARPDEAGVVLDLIKQLAIYENLRLVLRWRSL